MRFGLILAIDTPEDAKIQTEHIECRKSCNENSYDVNQPVVLKGRDQDLILAEESRKTRESRDRECRDQEGDVRHGHIFA